MYTYVAKSCDIQCTVPRLQQDCKSHSWIDSRSELTLPFRKAPPLSIYRRFNLMKRSPLKHYFQHCSQCFRRTYLWEETQYHPGDFFSTSFQPIARRLHSSMSDSAQKSLRQITSEAQDHRLYIPHNIYNL